MSDQQVSPVPEHVHTINPRIVVRDGRAAIAFYREAFGAELLAEPFTTPDGGVIHAELRIGDSILMLFDEGSDGDAPAKSPQSLGDVVTAVMATYWEDVDAVWERARAAGAEVIYPLDDHFYGERGGRIRDPFGHQWMLSQRIEELSIEELNRRAEQYFAASG
jgi:PhnB protein